MIVSLKGKYSKKTPAYVWMSVQGVTYEVHISLHTYSAIQHHEEGALLTYLQVKEDAHTLYGFHDEAERHVFLLLISVSGVGASTARMMLSSMKPDEISQAIANGDEKKLEKIKGIGAKSAKRLILELREKVIKNGTVTESNPQPTHNITEQDALHALVSLGIARQTAWQAIQKVLSKTPELNLEDLIKHALKNI